MAVKQNRDEKAFFYFGLFGFVLFILSDLLMVYQLRIDGSADWQNYAIFGALWGLGLLFGAVAWLTHLSIFWGLSAAFYWSYFSLFGLMYGTVHEAMNGVVGDSNAAVAGTAVEILAWSGVLLLLLAMWLRKKALLILSAVVQGVLSFFYTVEFVCMCQDSFGLGQSGFTIQIASALQAGASTLLLSGIVVLHVLEIVQVEIENTDIGEVILEAENHENDFDPNT